MRIAKLRQGKFPLTMMLSLIKNRKDCSDGYDTYLSLVMSLSCHVRVQGHEDEQATLRKAIYAANTELLDIRGMLTGGNSINKDKMTVIQKQITSLQESMTAVEDSLSDADMLKAINNVQTYAASLKKTVKMIKK